MKKNKQIILCGLMTVVLLVSGCSVTDENDYVYNRSATRNLPEVATVRPPQQPAPRYIPPPVKKPQPKPYKPKVHKYTPSTTTDTVITQKEVAAVNGANDGVDNAVDDNADANKIEKWEEEIKQKAEVTTDPYENIPDDSSASKPKITNATEANSQPLPSSTTKGASTKKPAKPLKPSEPSVESSSAVKTLLIKARADLAIGRTSSAIDKLERGLRIEPRNSLLWYQLARANYEKESFNQAISMAKKSIQNTNRDYIIAKNWMLIKKAGLKSGDTVVVKEAINYFKINP